MRALQFFGLPPTPAARDRADGSERRSALGEPSMKRSPYACTAVPRRFILILVALAAFAACGHPASHRTATVTPTVAAIATAIPTPTPDLSATVVPDLAAELQTLNDFKAQYGEPPAATLGRIRIPRIGVDAAIDQRIAPPDLDLSNLNPLGPTDVTWYNFQVNPAFGGEPGSGKNAIFAGHVDYNYAVHWANEAHYDGPGVFAGVSLLEPNDAIEITMNGKTTRYGVVWKKQVPQDTDWGAIFAANVPEGDSITLITCTGDFNPATLEYDARTVVRAHRF